MLWRLFLTVGVLVTSLAPTSCCPLTPPESLELRGVFLDDDTMLPLVGVSFTGRTLSDGEQTDFHSSIAQGIAEESDADGNFLMLFNGGFGCGDRVPQFPFPDEIELVVSLAECEYQVTIPINDATMDIGESQTPEVEGFPAIVLKEPVVVPPCDE